VVDGGKVDGLSRSDLVLGGDDRGGQADARIRQATVPAIAPRAPIATRGALESFIMTPLTQRQQSGAMRFFFDSKIQVRLESLIVLALLIAMTSFALLYVLQQYSEHSPGDPTSASVGATLILSSAGLDLAGLGSGPSGVAAFLCVGGISMVRGDCRLPEAGAWLPSTAAHTRTRIWPSL
jgi:hypothetical protein